ncbi:MAG: DUF5615 family PIN-like protein [Planctomycetota bacterium]|jgi:hypothetical protein|nr:DUF5615 family PIN-like protein [Planctomycetota bacterium]MDP7248640.1 DUF5615 family PIN-like protein [Planctomycetota bacterium]
MHLYLDEDASRHALVAGLRARNVDVSSAIEANTLGEPDEYQLDFAISEGRSIFTFNVADFCRLHSEYTALGKTHPGIIVCPHQNLGVGLLIRKLASLARKKSADDMLNQLEFI